MCEQLSTHIGPDAGAFVLHRKRRITHVPYWWVNNPTLGEFCFAMIGRADIEGSKSDVAMDAWPPQASYPCGSISHAFAVRIRTENQDQVSICLFALREVSVLSELALGHLRYALTDVPPQSNSPPDTVIGAGRRATGAPQAALTTSPRTIPEGTARSHGQKPPVSRNSPADPTFRANSFPEVTNLICRLPLPTLFYRLEAVHLGDLLRISAEPLPGTHTLNQKRELWLGLHTTSASSFALPRKTALANRHLSALRLQMPHSPLNRRTANPSLEASSPTYSNKRVNADQIRQLFLDEVYHLIWAAIPNNPTPRHVKMGRRRQLDRSCTFSGAPVKGNLNKRANPSSRSIRYTSQPQRSCDSALDSSQFTRRYYGNPRRKIKAGMPVSQALRHSMRRTGAPELRSVKRELEPQVRASTPKPHSRAEQVNHVLGQARALPRRLITATDVAASTNTPLVTARKTGNETTIPSQCVMCLPQQPLNDAQTPAQPLGRPTSVHTPLAQRTNQARRPATDTLPHSSHPQAFTCAALSGTPAPTYGSTPKAWLVRQLPRNVGQRPQVISNDLCPSADGGIWWCQRSPNRTAGSPGSDGRCVQRAGTYSERVDDSPLQGIPRSRTIIAMSDPNHGKFSPVYQPLSGKDKHADFASVARVQPRTSKGITDLLLLNFVRLNTENPSKKLCPQKQ
ncbi:hypothetical protein niasHT_038975 [Heterodera trifolii]|uniref:Uncharacterized protein n=1 Tax=Heterodera trifolii TaxID=157864 RepID=A0ABD2IBY2_9BILA